MQCNDIFTEQKNKILENENNFLKIHEHNTKMCLINDVNINDSWMKGHFYVQVEKTNAMTKNCNIGLHCDYCAKNDQRNKHPFDNMLQQ